MKKKHFDDLYTLESIAIHLGVGVPSLYTYISMNKQYLSEKGFEEIIPVFAYGVTPEKQRRFFIKK